MKPGHDKSRNGHALAAIPQTEAKPRDGDCMQRVTIRLMMIAEER